MVFIDELGTGSKTHNLADLLELIATKRRRAEDILREHPDCLYHDTDSLFLRDSESSRKVLIRYKIEMSSLYGRFGQVE